MFKITLTAFSLFLAAIFNGAESRTADFNLMQFMVQSSSVQHTSPASSAECLGYYIPLLNDITNEYQTNYKQCVSTADESREGIDESTEADRDQIEGLAHGACSALSACDGLTDSISYFECYAAAGFENTKVMYNIQTNSTALLAKVTEAYRLVDNDFYACTNATERKYVEDTANTYEEMQSCMAGKTPVPEAPAPAPEVPAPAPEEPPPAPEVPAPAPEVPAPAPEVPAPAPEDPPSGGDDPAPAPVEE